MDNSQIFDDIEKALKEYASILGEEKTVRITDDMARVVLADSFPPHLIEWYLSSRQPTTLKGGCSWVL